MTHDAPILKLSSDFVMQSEAITTITARYSIREDRIFVDCLIHTGDKLQIAFTHRLSRALVCELARQVSKRTDNPLMHDFAQNGAINNKSQSEAVNVDDDSPAWLVTHVHFQKIEAGVRVIFTEDNSRAVHLDCSDEVLRNIIDIFHKSFVAADWDLCVFPAWAAGQAGATPQSQVMN